MTDEPRMTAGSGGPSVDAHGDAVIDPTRNVLDLVAAAIQRQDDLRQAGYQAIRGEVRALADLTQSRFKGIDDQLAIIESRRVEQKIDTKVAVDAALSAAEKAVKEQTTASEKAITKSETSAAEQSKQQNATFTAALNGVSAVLADLKDRVVKIESRREGGRESDADSHRGIASTTAIIAVALSALMIFVVIALATHGFTK
jgi:hypothetical protein